MIYSGPVRRSGSLLCGNEGGDWCGEGRGCAVASAWNCCGVVQICHHLLELLLGLLKLLGKILVRYRQVCDHLRLVCRCLTICGGGYGKVV